MTPAQAFGNAIRDWIKETDELLEHLHRNKMIKQLIGNRVLIEPVMEETAKGFVIPEEYRTFRIGIVAAVGNGRRLKNGQREKIEIPVGAKVALSDDYRMPIEIDHKQYFLVSPEKVMAVIP